MQGRRLKLYYATQTGVKPVRLRLFVNDPRVRTPAYEQYLVRELRGAFGLEGAPVRLDFRASEGDAPAPRPRRPAGGAPRRSAGGGHGRRTR